MEKRLITYLFIIFSCNLIFAEVHKGSFFIDGLKFETENSDKVFLVEESYTITEDDLFHCIYEIHNIISRKSGQKIPKIANLQYYKSKANYGTKKKGISR